MPYETIAKCRPMGNDGIMLPAPLVVNSAGQGVTGSLPCAQVRRKGGCPELVGVRQLSGEGANSRRRGSVRRKREHTGRMTRVRMRCVGMALLTALLLPAGVADARTWVVNQQHPKATDRSRNGTEDRPFKTINAATPYACPGDTVLVHPGIYRECVRPYGGGLPGKPVTYQGATDPKATNAAHQVIIRGTEIWKADWRPVGDEPGVFRATLDAAMFPDWNPFLKTVHPKRGRGTHGQVFVNGTLLKEVTDHEELSRAPGSWLVTGTNLTLKVRFPKGIADPAKCEVEIATRQQAFVPQTRGLGYVHVRGFVFERVCNHVSLPSQGMVSAGSGHHWLFESNVFRFAKGIALEIGNETFVRRDDRRDLGPWTGYHVVRNNTFADNAQCGIAGVGSTATRITGNIVERNGWLVQGAESAGIKLHWFWDGVVEGNLVRDNGGWGIWVDHGIAGSRITRNVVLNNGCGIFLELSDDELGRALVDHNVVAHSRNSGMYGGIYGHGDGIYTHDASDVWVLHNLIFANEGFGVRMRIDSQRRYARRHTSEREIASCRRQRVLGNLILGNALGAVAFAFQNSRVRGNLSDYNVVGGPTNTPPSFMLDTGNGESTTAETIGRRVADALLLSALPPPVVLRTRWLEKKGWIEKFPQVGVRLDLRQWQRYSTNGVHSVVSRRHDVTIDTDGEKLVLAIDGAPWRMDHVPERLSARPARLPAGRRLPALERDFFGETLPAGKPLPGPFQNLREGRNTFVVWPVEVAEDPPPEEFLNLPPGICHP